MFSIRIERVFTATHAIRIGGDIELPHAHDWRVRVTLESDRLDEDGLLCDFHDLETQLDQILAPLKDADLNKTPPFDRINPSAERIVEYLAGELRSLIPDHVQALQVAITEAPGCEARYRLNTRA